jgi:hypothetical protein
MHGLPRYGKTPFKFSLAHQAFSLRPYTIQLVLIQPNICLCRFELSRLAGLQPASSQLARIEDDISRQFEEERRRIQKDQRSRAKRGAMAVVSIFYLFVIYYCTPYLILSGLFVPAVQVQRYIS